MTEPYWSNINWASIAALITAIAALSAPFFNGLWSNRNIASSARAKQSETEIERLERREREQYERTEKRAQVAEQDAEDCRLECEECRNQSRGMEDWAHWFRHELLNMQRRLAALLEISEKGAAGEYAPERYVEILRQARATLPLAPPNVPLMRDADKVKPP